MAPHTTPSPREELQKVSPACTVRKMCIWVSPGVKHSIWNLLIKAPTYSTIVYNKETIIGSEGSLLSPCSA